jgi:hypothetical protein
MSRRTNVIVIDKDPRSMKELLTKGEPEVLSFSLLVVRFNMHFPSLIHDVMSVNPSLVVLGSGFGVLPNIGENFLSELSAAGFKGSVVVCCQDTYKVLPCAKVIWIEPKEGVVRKRLAELAEQVS